MTRGSTPTTRGSTPTLKSIAESLGLSATTVSRALNGHAERYRISEPTVRAVREAAEQLGFSPDPLARGLRLRKTLTIGLVIPDVSNPFFAAIARAVTLEARQRGYSIMLCDTQDDEAQEAEALDLLRGRKVEGLVVCPVGRSAEHLPGTADEDPPIVLVDRYFPAVALPYVTSDNAEGGRLAIEHLLDRGHRRFGVLQGAAGTAPNEDRLQGVARAVQSSGVVGASYRIAGDSFTAESGYRAASQLLADNPELTAFFALSNVLCTGALEALAEAGKRVPEDVSLICFDDHPYASFLAAPMTTITQQSESLGRTAAGRLLDRVQGKADSEEELGILLPTQLVKRTSVRDLR